MEDVEKLVKAVKEVGKRNYKKECLKRAKKFDTKNFIKKMKQEIER